ncbi:MAG: Heme peroxidase, partial [Actinomycetia bacterium]|nr:Heme peroxidase [Actinomycetes bacterium]
VTTSAASAAVSSMPKGLPTAPASVTATAAKLAATMAWTAASDGGSPYTSWKVDTYQGTKLLKSQTVTGSARSASITGLKASTAYSFRVAAVTALGTSTTRTSSTVTTPR